MKYLHLLVLWLPRPTRRWGRLFLLSIVAGVLSGSAAAALDYGLRFGSERLINRYADTAGVGLFAFHGLVVVLPVVGGLASGIILYLLARDYRTHGTNDYINAFHQRGGVLPLRKPAVFAASSVGVISCGGAAGPEGPIVALGAAIGSSIGRLFGVSPAVARQLLVAGCAAGVGAIFQCPLGGALFATSVLYWEPEFEAAGIVPALIASVISFATFTAVAPGSHRLLQGAEGLYFAAPSELLVYAALGVLCGVVVIFYERTMRGVERRSSAMTQVPVWLRPALGGLVVGGIGCLFPQVLGGQYHFIQHAMDRTLTVLDGVAPAPTYLAALFGAVMVGKCVANAFTVGSGAAGGTFGPSVFIGGAAGAFLGAMLDSLLPGTLTDNLRMALIAAGMAGVLSAAMRTPLAAIVMVTEMTGGYGLIVPLMLVSVTAYVIGRRSGLNTAQVRSASQSPAHAGDVLLHILEAIRARDLADPQWPYTVTPATSLGEMIQMAPLESRPVFLVTEKGRLEGLVSIANIRKRAGNAASDPAFSRLIIAADLMTTRPPMVFEEENLYEALEVFRSCDLEVLPVVSGRGRRVLGMLPRRAIQEVVSARLKALRAQIRTEHGQLSLIEQDEQLQQLVAGVEAPTAPSVQRIPVPPDVVGKTLRQVNFRQLYNAQVIGIQSPDGHLQCPPNIDRILLANELLVVLAGGETAADVENPAPGPPSQHDSANVASDSDA